jgi:aspartate carbamoyltransferase catalytic subunit
MKLKHILSTKQFSDTAVLDGLFRRAAKFARDDKRNALRQSLKGKILACVFYEPSTRTRFSFEAAMYKLGGEVLTTEAAAHVSSAVKGESLEDSIRVIGGYADAIVLRHYEEGSAAAAAAVSTVPILNAGDGPGEHPTQALLDLYTIQSELGTLRNLKVALVGDLLYGRTVHSLLHLLALYNHGLTVSLVAPRALRLPKRYTDYLREKKVNFSEVADIGAVAPSLDVVYVTRIQKERFSSAKEYERLKGSYTIDKRILAKFKKKAIVMHPLPRVGEIAREVDADPRAAYFRQAKNGLYIRMALLEMLLA